MYFTLAESAWGGKDFTTVILAVVTDGRPTDYGAILSRIVNSLE